MSCVVGVVEGSHVYIGADSAGVEGWFSVERRDEKVFRNGPFIMGFTTSFRMGQLLRHVFTPPIQPEDESIERYMIGAFVNAVRDCLKSGGFAEKEKERESGGTFLVGYRSRLFEIDADYQVGENRHGYAAVGCGHELAMGALHATVGRAAGERVIAALSAAATFSAAVRPPFVVLDSE